MDETTLSPKARALIRDLRRMIGILVLGGFLAGLWLGWVLFSCNGAKAAPFNPLDPECATDTCVFAQCERDLQRPCTDADVFGPSEEDDAE